MKGEGSVGDVSSISIQINGGGSVITTGIKLYLVIPFPCLITQVTLLADQAGDIVIDIWRDVIANHPPTIADTIVAAAKPTLSGEIANQDSTLTGWSKVLRTNDILAYKVDSVSVVTFVTLTLKVIKL